MQSIRNIDLKNGSETLRKGSVSEFKPHAPVYSLNQTELSPNSQQPQISDLDFFSLNHRFIKDVTDEIIFPFDAITNISG